MRCRLCRAGKDNGVRGFGVFVCATAVALQPSLSLLLCHSDGDRRNSLFNCTNDGLMVCQGKPGFWPKADGGEALRLAAMGGWQEAVQANGRCRHVCITR